MIKIRLGPVKGVSCIVLALPVVLFALGWLKWAIAVPAALLVAAACFFAVRGFFGIKGEEDSLEISRRALVFTAVAIMAWCFFAGQGGFFYQSDDYNWRNAIFRDLINCGWPVTYRRTDSALVYYIGYWMVPALFGKAVKHFFGAGAAWEAANILMYFWTFLFIFLTFLLLFFAVKARSFLKITLAIAVFIFFSGMDILGILYYNQLNVCAVPNHLEWWSSFYQYSSNTTQLFWVFNQSVPAWLGAAFLLNETGTRNYAYLGFLLLAFSPLPFIGFVPFFIVLAAKYGVEAVRKKRLREFFRDIFSPQNVLALLVVFPLYFLYYGSNMSASENGFRFDMGFSEYGVTAALCRYVIFCALEFGILALILLKKYHGSLLYWISVLSLCLIGMFKIGSGRDFAMRASIPALTLLTVFAIRSLFEAVQIDRTGAGPCLKLNRTAAALLIVLAIGFFTPATEFSRAIHSVAVNGRINMTADQIKTFADKPPDTLRKFLAKNYQSAPCFRYLARIQ